MGRPEGSSWRAARLDWVGALPTGASPSMAVGRMGTRLSPSIGILRPSAIESRGSDEPRRAGSSLLTGRNDRPVSCRSLVAAATAYRRRRHHHQHRCRLSARLQPSGDSDNGKVRGEDALHGDDDDDNNNSSLAFHCLSAHLWWPPRQAGRHLDATGIGCGGGLALRPLNENLISGRAVRVSRRAGGSEARGCCLAHS